jgi:hypothetical protein
VSKIVYETGKQYNLRVFKNQAMRKVGQNVVSKIVYGDRKTI